MKRFILLIFTFVFSVSVLAQNDVTKFLGIPVDGYKPEMINKLKDKGFIDHPYKSDMLVGEFNGRDVYVSVVTNKNKVYRIFLADRYPVSEADIKVRFNTLCRQFEKNKNYMVFSDHSIPEDEDISFQMLVANKRYEAVFYQVPEQIDILAIQARLLEEVQSLYTPEEIINPTEEIQSKMYDLALEHTLLEIVYKKTVWFKIDKDGNNYRILMFYDNELNEASGEDL